MKNSNVSEKSKGVLIFAKNTETIDYVAIARRAEQLINHYLNLPVTIVEPTVESTTNVRYNIDSNKFEQWNNSGRYQAYELSPYDQTILLDSDYLVMDDNLLKILEVTDDYKIAGSNDYINQPTSNSIGKYSLESLWATVIVFNKTPKSKMLFDLVKRIEKYYAYYSKLYNFPRGNYRNDYAFTIADNMLNGYIQDSSNYIPWAIKTVNQQVNNIVLRDNQLIIKTKDQGYVIPKQNLHIISKEFLLSDQCEQLIKEATNA